MRGLPNMAVISPADAVETRLATGAISDWPGPVYMRLGRYPGPDLFGSDYLFEVGKAVTLREGGDVAIFATGHMGDALRRVIQHDRQVIGCAHVAT